MRVIKIVWTVSDPSGEDLDEAAMDDLVDDLILAIEGKGLVIGGITTFEESD